MRKLFLNLIIIGLGASLWWLTARTARFSVKNWDAKFESVLRHGLENIGLTDQDLLSSVHQIKNDKRGQWVSHQLTVKNMSDEKVKELVASLEDAGANVERTLDGKSPMLVVKRGARVYQEIRFTR